MKSLLIIGRSGNGKSSVGNTILRVQGFSTKGPSEEAEISFKKGSNETFVVVDASGVGDTGSDLAGDTTDVISCVFKAMHSIADNSQTASTGNGRKYQASNTTDMQEEETSSSAHLTRDPFDDYGYHAVIFVLKYGVRFTKQEKDAVQMVKSIFGVDTFKHWGILVFSYGDNFGLDQTDFEAWCIEQSGDIKELFEEVQYRCVIFDNQTSDETKKKKQLGALEAKINLLQNGRIYNLNIFCNHCFEKYESAYKNFIKTAYDVSSGINMEAKRKLLDNEWIQLKAMLEGDRTQWSDVDKKIGEEFFSPVYEDYAKQRMYHTKEFLRSLH